MSKFREIKRRDFLKYAGTAGGAVVGLALAGCAAQPVAPQIVEKEVIKTVLVEKAVEVEKKVVETVVVEKAVEVEKLVEVEKIVKVEKEVIRTIEVQATPKGWEMFPDLSGTKVTFLTMADPSSDAFEKVAAPFLSQTGLALDFIAIDWDGLREKVIFQVSSGSGEYDAFLLDEQWVEEMYQWLVPLDEFTSPTGEYASEYNDEYFQWDDLMQPVLAATYARGDGRDYAIPYMYDVKILCYREDLYTDAGEMADFESQYGYPLAPATTAQQLMDTAEFFTRPSEGIYGFIDSGARGYQVFTFGEWLYAAGASWFVESDNQPLDWRPNCNNPAGIKSLEDYVKIMNDFSPPEALSATLAEVSFGITSGTAACANQWLSQHPIYYDPNQNPYHDRVRSTPNALLGCSGQMSWAFPVTRSPSKQKAAFRLVQYVYSPQGALDYVKAGGAPIRTSVLENEELKASQPGVADIFSAGLITGQTMWYRPKFADYGGFADIVNRYIPDALIKVITPAEAMQGIEDELTVYMQENGYL